MIVMGEKKTLSEFLDFITLFPYFSLIRSVLFSIFSMLMLPTKYKNKKEEAMEMNGNINTISILCWAIIVQKVNDTHDLHWPTLDNMTNNSFLYL